MTSPAFEAALRITQEAVKLLAKWAGSPLADKFPDSPLEDSIQVKKAVETAKQILCWTSLNHNRISHLKLLFDCIDLPKDHDCEKPLVKVGKTEHYWLPEAIKDKNPTIPYPQDKSPNIPDLRSKEANDFSQLQEEIKTTLQNLDQEDWENLSLLSLILEKFGSFISFGKCDIALVDIARTTAAVAAAIASDADGSKLSLIAGDLSGIQKFIYTISSSGALKSLRARSFYLELVIEEIVQQLLAELELPRTNIIYAGGGNLYLIASANEQTQNKVKQVKQRVNKWLNKEFQGKIFLALDYRGFDAEDVATEEFAKHWKEIVEQLNIQKMRKFDDQINRVLARRKSYSERCQVCHRDDTKNLKELTLYEGDTILTCQTCFKMYQLGDRLFGVESIIRSSTKDIDAVDTISFRFFNQSSTSYWNLYKGSRPIVKNNGTVFLINNWTVEDYQFKHFRDQATPLLLGNYGKKIVKDGDERFIRAGEMAEVAKGIDRVGYLRMDVDRLGQIFAKGFGKNQTLLLPRLAGLSRQISYFFKVYLNTLAKERDNNFIQPLKNGVKGLKEAQYLTHENRDNLLFIYAGGDDLFISGAWDQIVEFTFDIYQCFRAYTGYNPDITISGGISIDDIKFPLYQAARASGDAEEAAKSNGRDSLGLFGQVFKWDEWLGSTNIDVADIQTFNEGVKKYLGTNVKLDLFGILPLVKQLINQQLEISYARSFVRNLLNTAQIQEQMIKEIENKQKKEQYENHLKDIRYYLHLPKIAYSLTRLPDKVLNNLQFLPIRKSLMSPYNAPYFRAIATWIELLNRS